MKSGDITEKLQQMAEAITGPLLIEDLTKKTVEVCKDIMGADACSIFLIDDKKPNRLVMKASRGYSHDLSDIAEYILPPKDRNKQKEKIGVTAWIAKTGNTFQTKTHKDFNKCPEHRGKYDVKQWGKKNRSKCQSFYGAPLKTWDRIYGVLKVESKKKNYFEKEHTEALKIIASMITSSLRNVMIIESFHSLSEDIGEHPANTKNLIHHLAEVCVKLSHAEACSIFIINEANGRLVLRGDYGHAKSFVDDESPDYTYAPGEGVTGTVFQTGKPSSVNSEGEVKRNKNRKNKLYPAQWKKKKHVCHSWYQFPLGKQAHFLGVMKIENKLGGDGKPIAKGGFNQSEKQVLEILANSVVSLIIAMKTEKGKNNAVDTLNKIGYPTDINKIFSTDLLKDIKRLHRIRNPKLHKKIMHFIRVIEKKPKNNEYNYLEIIKENIETIGKEFGIDKFFMEYSESLEFYEPILYQLPKYRAHFVHQLNVFLNGYLILNKLNNKQFTKIKNIIAKKCKVKEGSINIFKIWFVTAIFHDTGYPLAKVGDWIENFMYNMFKEKFELSPTMVQALSVQLFREDFRESLNSLIKHLSVWLKLNHSNQLDKISKEIHDRFFENLSENLIPGLLLIKANKLSIIDDCTLSTAVSAIALDEGEIWKFLRNRGLKKDISYIDHPIAFLLVYCDNVQEYGRPKGGPGKKTQDIGEFAVIKQELDRKKGIIECILTYKKQPENWVDVVKPKLKEIKDFWKSPSDLEFHISYITKKGKFDELIIKK